MSNIECMNDADGKCDSAIEYRYAYDLEDLGGVWIFRPRPV